VICQRDAYAHGVITGRTAQEFEPGGKAAEEMEQRSKPRACGFAPSQDAVDRLASGPRRLRQSLDAELTMQRRRPKCSPGIFYGLAMTRGLSMHQVKIVEMLRRAAANGTALEAADLEHLFFNELDRKESPVPGERRKVCRAKAKRAILSLRERGLVDIFYAQHPHDPEYGPKRMFAELREQ
jgi:hypothetical protein